MRGCGVQIAPLSAYAALYFEEDTEQQRVDILKEQRERLFHRQSDLEVTITRLNAKIENLRERPRRQITVSK